MSKYIENTTELIIRSLLDIGQTIKFSSSGYGKNMDVFINGEPPVTISAYNFPQLNELVLGHYLQLGIEAGKRIDGGCTNEWHHPGSGDPADCNGEKCEPEHECNSPWHLLSASDKASKCSDCGESARPEKRECKGGWHGLPISTRIEKPCTVCGQAEECKNIWHTLPLNEIAENCPSCNEKRYVTDYEKKNETKKPQ